LRTLREDPCSSCRQEHPPPPSQRRRRSARTSNCFCYRIRPEETATPAHEVPVAMEARHSGGAATIYSLSSCSLQGSRVLAELFAQGHSFFACRASHLQHSTRQCFRPIEGRTLRRRILYTPMLELQAHRPSRWEKDAFETPWAF